jgi:ABC-type branched-subunit amino acid transport system ATPase component
MTNQKRKTQINYLNNLTKPSQDKPIMMTIFGQAGLGKTTLAESFEKPILIPVEDGTASLIGQDVSVMPRPRNHADLLNQII